MRAMLPVMETFHSIQGEGAHVGRSAFFIRLASCKVGCKWCDTKDSWSPDIHPQKSVIDLSKEAAKAQHTGAAFIVITGGEPLHHDLEPLCIAIRKITSQDKINPMPIHIETSGVDKLSGNPNWITLSPKRHAPPRQEVLSCCQELKVVIQEKEDLIFAEQMANDAQVKSNTSPLLFLQPGWNNPKGHELVFNYVKKNSNWRLSMQTHKWLGVL